VLYPGDYYLLAQSITSTDESQLNQFYEANYPPFDTGVDQEHISKATILTAHLRKTITAATLDEACNLTLHFENDSQLTIPTDADIVDWQWALNTSGNDPYLDCLVGCFWSGEISINEANNEAADKG
jgi:hypothetical protein